MTNIKAALEAICEEISDMQRADFLNSGVFYTNCHKCGLRVPTAITVNGDIYPQYCPQCRERTVLKDDD